MSKIIELADAYAEARHVNGSHLYNEQTASARAALQAEVERLKSTTQVAWEPLTPKLLDKIDLGEYGRRFWILPNGGTEPFIATYKLVQGWNPHQFVSLQGLSLSASDIAYVAPYVPPALPKGGDEARGNR